jgi:hypothetical protein
MAPITRSSLHGRSISREGSWQIPTEEELTAAEKVERQEGTSENENMEDQSSEDRSFEDGSDDDPFHGQQGTATCDLLN